MTWFFRCFPCFFTQASASAARAGASFMIVRYCTHSPLGRHSLLACTRYPLPLTLEFWEIDHENFAGH